ncbi:MAG TPA: hypothetical protein VGX27_14090 [Candidatus Dormibacteraeota bacterium]|nr:hypothetical protein [Candidatus Dormibacteraeota bacterium]
MPVEYLAQSHGPGPPIYPAREWLNPREADNESSKDSRVRRRPATPVNTGVRVAAPTIAETEAITPVTITTPPVPMQPVVGAQGVVSPLHASHAQRVAAIVTGSPTPRRRAERAAVYALETSHTQTGQTGNLRPDVRIHIGKVELRAPNTSAAHQPPRASATTSGPRGFADYALLRKHLDRPWWSPR